MTTLLARRFKVDISADGTNWIPLYGITSFQDPVNRTTQDASDYDSDGWGAFEVTTQTWTITATVNVQTTSGALTASYLMLSAAKTQFGDAARVYVRYYDRTGLAEAFQGRAIVSMVPKGNAVADINSQTVTLQGDGALAPITNPYTPTVAPVVTAITPSGAAAGALITITGVGFTGTVATTGVKVGGVNATNWSVVSDGVIVATVPTGTAGSAPIVVTNAVGASNSFAYTRA